MYYVFTGKRKKSILVTKSHEEAFEFIMKNKDAKVRTLDHTPKLKILNRVNFLKTFYKEVNDVNKLFQLIEVMVKGKNNRYDLINLMGLLEEYKIHKELFHKKA